MKRWVCMCLDFFLYRRREEKEEKSVCAYQSKGTICARVSMCDRRRERERERESELGRMSECAESL